MIMDPPITHPLTILIRQSTRTSECQLVPYTGSIAGHICVLAGGGEDAVVVSSLGCRRTSSAGSAKITDGSARARLPTGRPSWDQKRVNPTGLNGTEFNETKISALVLGQGAPPFFNIYY